MTRTNTECDLIIKNVLKKSILVAFFLLAKGDSQIEIAVNSMEMQELPSIKNKVKNEKIKESHQQYGNYCYYLLINGKNYINNM